MNEHELYITKLKLDLYFQKIEELKEHTERNMKALNTMMLELKGIVGMVRAQSKGPGMQWYSQELQAEGIKNNENDSKLISKHFEIEDLSINEIELKK